MRKLFAVATALAIALGALASAPPAGAANPWVRVAAPNPSVERNILFGVSCTSPTDCTAVGHFWGPTAIRSLLIRTVNGTSWTRINPPVPAQFTQLTDVSCTSPTECTAVGAYARITPTAIEDYTYIVRTTNGTTWNQVTSPSPGKDSELFSVSCVTATRCRAVGRAGNRTLVLRTSNGTNWFREASPNRGTGRSSLLSIDCADNANCMAVGAYSTGPGAAGRRRTLAMKVAGGPPWTLVDSPNPAPNQSDTTLQEVSCPTPTTCVTVGHVSPAVGQRAYILRTTDGATWTRGATPGATWEVDMIGVDCVSATACTATGTEWQAEDLIRKPVILRTTNGTTWTSPSPSSEVLRRGLFGVSCVTEVACVSVGAFNDTGNLDDPVRALVMKET